MLRAIAVQNATDLNDTFSIDVNLDLPHKHPSKFCHPCKSIIYSCKKAAKEDRIIERRKVVHVWQDHHGEECPVCFPLPDQGGRPKKRVILGRPPILAPISAARHIMKIAPAKLASREHITVPANLDDECPLCLDMLVRPIELTT